MTMMQAAILGLVQGLCEFLPVSSSGHLLFVQNILRIEENMMAFDVFLHLGTLVPVILIFWKEIWVLVKSPFQKTTYLLAIGTIPAVVAVLILGDYVDNLFEGGPFLAAGFIITGTLLLISDNLFEGHKKIKDITYGDAVFVGVIQAIAIIPGISRSGSTITGGIVRKFDKRTAAAFSFLLSIPAILGAVVFSAKDFILGDLAFNVEPGPAVCGFFTAMVSGYVAIRFMLRLIRNKKLKYFAYYVYALAALISINTFVKIF